VRETKSEEKRRRVGVSDKHTKKELYRQERERKKERNALSDK